MYNLSLTDTMPFGEHKGKIVEDVIIEVPTYFRWAIEEEVIELDEEAFSFYEDTLSEWEFDMMENMDDNNDCYI